MEATRLDRRSVLMRDRCVRDARVWARGFRRYCARARRAGGFDASTSFQSDAWCRTSPSNCRPAEFAKPSIWRCPAASSISATTSSATCASAPTRRSGAARRWTSSCSSFPWAGFQYARRDLARRWRQGASGSRPTGTCSRSVRSSAMSAPGAPYGFSGFRVHGPINRPEYFDEYMVFQGASYFRAVGRGQGYGLSARGLAINTARPGGEEFPMFRAFWIEKPKQGDRSIIIHALLDSQSTTGAYRFEVEPGEATTVDVDGDALSAPAAHARRLRAAHQHVPARSRTSPHRRRLPSGACTTATGSPSSTATSECIWRPLTNPRMLQTSAFLDKNPKGFGLCQRARSFQAFEDLEARYERRPTLWIEPKGDVGLGIRRADRDPDRRGDPRQHRRLLEAGQGRRRRGTAFPFGYKMYWTKELPIAWSGASSLATRVGRGKKEDDDQIRRRLRRSGPGGAAADAGRGGHRQSGHDHQHFRPRQSRNRRRPGELRARSRGNRTLRTSFGVEARQISRSPRPGSIDGPNHERAPRCRAQNRPHRRREQPRAASA